MDRRRLLAATAAAGGAAAVAGCQGNGPGATGKKDTDKSSKKITVYVSADTNIRDLWKKDLIPKYRKHNSDVHVEIQFDQHGENDQQTVSKLAAATKQDKDPGIDLVDGIAEKASEADLLTDPADHVSNMQKVPMGIIDTLDKDSIPYRASSVLLAYLPGKISHPPKTLKDLLDWIRKNPGKFTYNKPGTGGAGDAFVNSVLSHNMSDKIVDKMNSGYHKSLQKHWDKGFSVLADLNKSMYQKGVYQNGNNGPLKLLGKHQIWMVPVWSDQFLSGQQNGTTPKEAKITQIKHPSLTGGATELGVPKASPRKKEALKLVNWLLEPEQQAAIAKSISGYPVIPLDDLPKKVRSKFTGADVSKLRPTFNSKMLDDMYRLWSQKVPRK